LAAGVALQFEDRFGLAARGLVAALGGDGLVGVAGGDDARAEGNRSAGEPVGVPAAVPALVAGADEPGDGPQAGSALRMRSPMIGCWRMNCHSASVSGPGLLRISSGTASLPTSCSSAARSTSSSCSASSTRLGATSVTSCPTPLTGFTPARWNRSVQRNHLVANLVASRHEARCEPNTSKA
jgi:hypothetical protein